MDPRQLSRLLLVGVVVAALAVGFALGRLTESSSSGSAGAGSGARLDDALAQADLAYGLVVQDLQSSLAAYGARAQGVNDHEQVVGLDDLLRGHEAAFADLASRARALGTQEGDAVADLAALVADRAEVVRSRAFAEDTGAAGVAEMQALGREAALRASQIGAALDGLAAATDPSEVWAAVALEVERPWPDADAEGVDEPVPAAS